MQVHPVARSMLFESETLHDRSRQATAGARFGMTVEDCDAVLVDRHRGSSWVGSFFDKARTSLGRAIPGGSKEQCMV